MPAVLLRLLGNKVQRKRYFNLIGSCLLQQQRAFPFQQRHVLFGDRPDKSIVDGGIFMCELIPEIDNPSSVRDGLERRWRRSRECRNGLAYCDELPLPQKIEPAETPCRPTDRDLLQQARWLRRDR